MGIFDLAVKKSELHPNFKRIMDDPYKKKVLEGWSDEKLINRDGNNKFIKEFQTTFNSSFWELYCYNIFKEISAEFDFSHEHPDFVINYGENMINIECAIASNANIDPDESDIYARLNESKSLDDIVYDQTIRLSNAFASKYKKYKEKYCQKDWVKNIPFVIAIEPFDQPYFMLTGIESIRLLLYGWEIEHNSLLDYKIEKIQKSVETTLDMGVFLDPKYSEISGVLFSNTATIGKVDAMGNDPDLTFGQIRYNLNYDRPQISVDSRLIQKKYDLRCKLIKDNFKQFENEYKKYTIRRPFIQWNVDYKENIFDGLTLFLNPYAKFPLPQVFIDALYNNGVNISRYDIEKNEDAWSACDHSLIQRIVVNLKR